MKYWILFYNNKYIKKIINSNLFKFYFFNAITLMIIVKIVEEFYSKDIDTNFFILHDWEDIILEPTEWVRAPNLCKYFGYLILYSIHWNLSFITNGWDFFWTEAYKLNIDDGFMQYINLYFNNLYKTYLPLYEDSFEWQITFINSVIFFLKKFFNYTFIEGYGFLIFYLFFIVLTFIGLVFTSFLGLYGVFVITITSLTCVWLFSLILFYYSLSNHLFLSFNLGSWFCIWDDLKVNFELSIDSLTITYIVLTLTISLCAIIYTFSYFRYEPLVERLILFLNLFIISMILFVLSNNLVVLFLGWELVGATSFVLINFWVTKKSTLKSAFKAFTFNKFSDVCFFLFIIIIFNHYYELNITHICQKANFFKNYLIFILGVEVSINEVIVFFIFSAASIKSAQIVGHAWLPDSMEAPVPASSLIHSATLVSAGVYLLLRFHPIIENTTHSIYIIPIIGSITAFYGGICAALQSDVKKVLAYSTISHCGFLVVSCLMFSQDFSLFYLYVHGFFKAGVFLCMGNVIRFNRGGQDFRKMGSFYKYLPFECCFTFIGLFNLGGFPASLGYLMKHLFITGNASLSYDYKYFLLIFIFSLMGALTGIFYSFRLFYYVFFDFKKAKPIIYRNVNKLNLKSFNYSNTTFSTNFCIFLLNFFAYFLIISIYVFMLKNKIIWWDNNLIVNHNYYDLFIKNFKYLWNLSSINWLILLIFTFTLISSWRRVINYEKIYENFHRFIIFIVFFKLFFTLLS